MINLHALKLTMLALLFGLAAGAAFLLMTAILPLWAGIAVIAALGAYGIYRTILSDMEESE